MTTITNDEMSLLFPNTPIDGRPTRHTNCGYFTVDPTDQSLWYHEPQNDVEEYHGKLLDFTSEDLDKFFAEYESRSGPKKPPYGQILELNGQQLVWCPLAEYYCTDQEAQSNQALAEQLKLLLDTRNLTIEDCWVEDHYRDPTAVNDPKINGWTIFLLKNLLRTQSPVF